MAQVNINNIRKEFVEGKPVLEDISFPIKDGEFVALLGASGCGKSTLLRIIAGLEAQTSGEILIDGKDVGSLSPKDRDIAMVFQNYALYPHLDVKENIGMGLKLRRFPPQEIAERVKEAAGKLGLSDLLDRKPAALSGGQRQRVALARSLVRRPKVFLLDEPLSNLDAVLREKTRGELKLLFKKVKGTVIFVTHDQIEAMTMSDRIVVMDKGHIQQIGSPEDIYHRPANTFVAGFLGAPPMNIFPLTDAMSLGLLAKEAAPSLRRRRHALARDAGLGQADPRADVLCGLRPEDMEVRTESVPGMKHAEVTLAEPTGAATVLTLGAGLTLRASVSGNWKMGQEEVWIRLPKEKLHFFDAATKARVV